MANIKYNLRDILVKSKFYNDMIVNKTLVRNDNDDKYA